MCRRLQQRAGAPRGAAGAGPRGGRPQADRLDIAELQRLFDAYTVMQAQEALQLDDEQFGRFLPKLKALQDTRRRGEQARNRLVADLGRLTAASAAVDESAVRARLRDLQELESQTSADLRRAYDTLDALLDVPRRRGSACSSRTWNGGSSSSCCARDAGCLALRAEARERRGAC